MGRTINTELPLLHSSDMEPNAEFARSQFIQEPNVEYAVDLAALRVHDAPATLLPGTSATDDLGLIAGTFGTDPVTVGTGDIKALGAVTRYARFLFSIPAEYEAGQSITVRLNAGVGTTIADTSATVDVECYLDGAGSDRCTTAAQSINSLSAANKDFAITATSVVPGSVLDIRIAIIANDGATGTAVVPEINKISLLLDIRG